MTIENDETNLLDIYRVLREDWGWIAGITGLFAVLTVIYALVATEIYRAEAVLLPADRGSGGRTAALAQQFGGLAGLAGVDLGGLSGDRQIATPYLQSRALVEEFIEQNNLMPVLYADEWDAENQHWLVEGEDIPTLWKATKKFREDILRINREQQTGLITVSIEWTDPVVAAEWANSLVALANENLRQRELAEARRNVEYLNQQIADTNIVGLQQVMFNLVEGEMQTMMLANARLEYAFTVVDPAVPPEQRDRPKRTLIVILGAMLGGILSLVFIGFRRLYRALQEQEAQRQGT